MDGSARALVLVVVEDKRALVAVAVGVGEDVLVDFAVAVPEVVEGEVGAAGEDVALGQQRSDLALVARDQALVGPLVEHRLLELHAVALGESLDLAMREHGQAGQRGQQGADAEVLVAGAKLVDGGALVGVAHEVDVALHDVGVELNGLLQVGAVLGVLLVAQHVHEGRVVHAMHPQGAHEVALEQPEGLGQQQRAGASAATRSTTSRQNSLGIRASNSSCDIAFSARDGMEPPAPGSGNQRRWTWRLASTMAASKRMMGKSRATCRMV